MASDKYRLIAQFDTEETSSVSLMKFFGECSERKGVANISKNCTGLQKFLENE